MSNERDQTQANSADPRQQEPLPAWNDEDHQRYLDAIEGAGDYDEEMDEYTGAGDFDEEDDDDNDEEDDDITAEGLIRAMAYGCPQDTAPDHIWREYCEAMRDLAQRLIEQDKQAAGTFGSNTGIDAALNPANWTPEERERAREFGQLEAHGASGDLEMTDAMRRHMVKFGLTEAQELEWERATREAAEYYEAVSPQAQPDDEDDMPLDWQRPE